MLNPWILGLKMAKSAEARQQLRHRGIGALHAQAQVGVRGVHPSSFHLGRENVSIVRQIPRCLYIYIYEPGPRTPTPPPLPPQWYPPPTPNPPLPPQNLVFACYLHIYIHIYTYILVLPFPPLQPRISTLFAALESHDLVNGPCLPVYFYHNLFSNRL